MGVASTPSGQHSWLAKVKTAVFCKKAKTAVLSSSDKSLNVLQDLRWSMSTVYVNNTPLQVPTQLILSNIQAAISFNIKNQHETHCYQQTKPSTQFKADTCVKTTVMATSKHVQFM